MTAPQPGRVDVAVLGSGNIATDLMMKIRQLPTGLRMSAMAGIDPASEGLARAERMSVAVTHEGIDGLAAMPGFDDVKVIFDATSATAHARHAKLAAAHGKVMIDLTPAALGPFVVPAVGVDDYAAAPDVNMVTCGGQATIPIVAAVSRVTPVAYAEIVAAIASRSAGPGTRANIDEFTETTGKALCAVGGAATGKAIIVLNPAEPPIVMRDTVFCLVEDHGIDHGVIADSIREMERAVAAYVPGYRLVRPVQFDTVTDTFVPALNRRVSGIKVSVFLAVRGAGHYLPTYAGNLDIMTSAALRTAERIAQLRGWVTA
ncbi:acetaldehyde dehydrogenase (acetylating) [Nocardia terpenica]|uniref:Acetaldehyde dehydrogenase n=1 Tax=Nocardia terpenica TaxID=455432 RepID=A0A291RRC7_9NOCA|nr:acetaldehyde dehydrogenase (acetylating) [Nocardia terpenica]ATL69809.1 acetaldehyde dehydrogenase (acetylating) [Nocardia terpenica]